MALQALQSSGVAFRKILSHFPEELSLAFAYGSGVFRQAGPNSDQKVSAAGTLPGQPPTHARCLPALLSVVSQSRPQSPDVSRVHHE